MGLATALLATGCAMPASQPASPLPGAQTSWYYVPGPYETVRLTSSGHQRAVVSPEIGSTWTVSTGDPPTTIVVTRLPDGRPATARIANADRNETAVFDPPLALVPAENAAETTSVSLYQGVHPTEDLQGKRMKRTGTAERRFLSVEDSTWTLGDTTYSAQEMTHELVLSLSPAEVRQLYVSLAVDGFGIVRESMTERVGVLGVRIGGREEVTEVIKFIDQR